MYGIETGNTGGTAIYVTFLLTIGATRLNFTLDNEQLPDIFEFQQNVPFFVYNATVYSNSSLTPTGSGPNGMHNLTISSIFHMTFDFAQYTYVFSRISFVTSS